MAKRDESIIPLSREHHYALVLCLKIRRGLQRCSQDSDWLDMAASHVLRFFETDLAGHFAAEEQVLFPSMLEVGQRLARFLLEKAKREGRASGRGLEFKLEATHQELAAQIGTVRELVSRNLSRFQDQGIISIRNRTITVLDLERLEAEAEGE